MEYNNEQVAMMLKEILLEIRKINKILDRLLSEGDGIAINGVL